LRDPRGPARDPRLGGFGLAVAGAGFVAGLLASVLAIATVAAVQGTTLGEQTLGIAVASSVGLAMGFLVVPVLAARRRGGLGSFLGLRIRPVVDVPLGLVAGLASTFAASLITSAVLDASRRVELETKAKDVIDRAQQPASVVVLVGVLCVLTPLAEEVFFRGLVFRSLARLAPVPVAVVVGAVVFGVVHFSGGSQAVVLNQLGLLAGFGAVLCLLTWWTGRLGAAIVAHAAFNLVTVLDVVIRRR